MPLNRQYTEQTNFYRRTTPQDAIYHRNQLIYRRPALPEITSFRANPAYISATATTPTISLSWATTGATSLTLKKTVNGRTTIIPITFTTTSTITLGEISVTREFDDTVYDLTASNTSGMVHQDVTFFNTQTPTVRNLSFLGTQQTPGGTGLVYTVYSFSITIAGKPHPNTTFTGPGIPGGRENITRQLTARANNVYTATIRVTRTIQNPPPSEYRLTVTNIAGTVTQTVFTN